MYVCMFIYIFNGTIAASYFGEILKVILNIKLFTVAFLSPYFNTYTLFCRKSFQYLDERKIHSKYASEKKVDLSEQRCICVFSMIRKTCFILVKLVSWVEKRIQHERLNQNKNKRKTTMLKGKCSIVFGCKTNSLSQNPGI